MTQTYHQQLYLKAERYFRKYKLPNQAKIPQALNDYREFLGSKTIKELEEIIREFNDIELWRTDYMLLK